MARTPTPKTVTKHGQNIFIYNNIRTNQVIYSLTRTLNNHHSLKQLPFLGKNTIPPTLRKDLWHPLAHLHFPSPPGGLLAYRHLLEYRRLHETAYPLSLITQPAGTPHAGQLMSRKSRARVLMDQKANAVADVAAVLGGRRGSGGAGGRGRRACALAGRI
ncbi:MAG: hypothetical protein FRX48_07654 [Lasallia pustulata]|uniref:Large ribosomal subunit protein mL67 n=1 Tax=Lasallia pustulata TaxID=136370 RepID=A0A5M8PIY9_9LECA|nr:MAG: hypothetical protein FRX48_07654 [Lasallia pustulata]